MLRLLLPITPWWLAATEKTLEFAIRAVAYYADESQEILKLKRQSRFILDRGEYVSLQSLHLRERYLGTSLHHGGDQSCILARQKPLRCDGV